MKLALEKFEERKRQRRAVKVVKHIAQGSLGFGLGTGVGYAGMKGVEEISKRVSGRPISRTAARRLLPIATGALFAAYPVWKTLERDQLRKDMEGE